MRVSEFVAERRRATQPVDSDRNRGSGGLIPTAHIDFEQEEGDAPQFLEAPEKAPAPQRRQPRRVVPQQLDNEPPAEQQTDDAEAQQAELPSDTAGDDTEVDRMLLRLRVLNTFGKPLEGCFVAVTQDGGQAASWTSSNGLAEVLIRRPIRTETGEQQAEEIAREAEGKLQAPPPPAPAPGRTAHVNVLVSRDDTLLCSTRLYFQNVPENANDAFWNGTRVIQELGADYASYDIIVETGQPRD